MNLSIGIIGLPNVGKSTLFNLLTEQEVNAANYPFATVDPNVGVVRVPDERLDKIHKFYPNKKKAPAVVEFYDIAGLVRGANKGEGLGNQFLAQIREANVLVHLVRIFEGTDVAHVEGDIHPVRDMGVIENELRQKDLSTVEKRIDKEKGGEEKQRLEKLRNILESGSIPSGNELAESLNLLTAKPQIFLLNGDEENLSDEPVNKLEELNSDYVVMNLAKIEDLSPLIKESYKTLGVISFFSIGDDEVRSWTIRKGALAPEAAGAIHTDFQKNFVKAEVVHWQDLVEAGGWNKAKTRGLVRLKGKDYVVRDGDVILFKSGA